MTIAQERVGLQYYVASALEKVLRGPVGRRLPVGLVGNP
jgi:hypothetical protein